VIPGLLIGLLIGLLMACWWSAADRLLMPADLCSKGPADALLLVLLLKAVTEGADQQPGARNSKITTA
jgi:hypothetical protein